MKLKVFCLLIVMAALAIQAAGQVPVGYESKDAKKTSAAGSEAKNADDANAEKESAIVKNTVYVRQFWGNRDLLLNMIGEGLEKAKGLALVEKPDRAEYVLDLAVAQVAQSQNQNGISIYRRGFSLNVNPSIGVTNYLVTVTTWRDGERVGSLSRTVNVAVKTNGGGSSSIYIRGMGTSASGYSWSDGYTLAAARAIQIIYGH